jgi:hypothetical protein
MKHFFRIVCCPRSGFGRALTGLLLVLLAAPRLSRAQNTAITILISDITYNTATLNGAGNGGTGLGMA